MLDGLAGRDEAHFGDDTTCPEWVKQAVLSVAAARIEAHYNDQQFTTQDARRLMKSLIGHRDSDFTPSFDQQIPSSGGNPDGKDWASWNT